MSKRRHTADVEADEQARGNDRSRFPYVRPDATTTNALPVQVEGLEPFDEYVQRRTDPIAPDALREAVRARVLAQFSEDGLFFHNTFYDGPDDGRSPVNHVTDAVLAVVAKHRDAREQDALTALSLMVEERNEAQGRIARALAVLDVITVSECRAILRGDQ